MKKSYFMNNFQFFELQKIIFITMLIMININNVFPQREIICSINLDSNKYYNNQMGLWQFDENFGIKINKNKFDSIAINICKLNYSNDSLSINEYIELIRITNTLNFTGLRTICPFYYNCSVDFFHNRLNNIIQNFNLEEFVGGSLYDRVRNVQIGGPPLISNSYYHIVDLPTNNSK